jgi:transcriptional regulator with XRE-family HTH domain
MNPKLFGATITALRKKNGLTQTALAKLLNVSDKAVSKWETGLGYPEITLLP